MIATRFRTVVWVAGVAMAALCCYLVSLQVAAERAQVSRLDRGIFAARQDIRELGTELNTRSRLVQLERWNADVLALTAPKAGQYLTGEMQLASLATPPVAAASDAATPDAAALQAPPAVARAAYRQIGASPATRLVHTISMDLDDGGSENGGTLLHHAVLTRPAETRIALLETGAKPPRP
ncbi:MAG: hypothetical protein JWO65_1542 [Sphingomonas bacterium]|jgi:hypothetical protein|nr:hypothetical protein [Sphingomonas bacterium]